jgi:hypothetical protein
VRKIASLSLNYAGGAHRRPQADFTEGNEGNEEELNYAGGAHTLVQHKTKPLRKCPSAVSGRVLLKDPLPLGCFRYPWSCGFNLEAKRGPQRNAFVGRPDAAHVSLHGASVKPGRTGAERGR